MSLVSPNFVALHLLVSEVILLLFYKNYIVYRDYFGEFS